MDIMNMFNSLINTSNYFLENNDSQLQVPGTPSSSEIYINMLYRLILDNPNLIETKESKKAFYDVLMKFARVLLNDYYNDRFSNNNNKYTKSLDEFILQDWINENDNDDYHVGIGAYILYGVMLCQIKEMLKKSEQ
jgi:hypothetical protein